LEWRGAAKELLHVWNGKKTCTPMHTVVPEMAIIFNLQCTENNIHNYLRNDFSDTFKSISHVSDHKLSKGMWMLSDGHFQFGSLLPTFCHHYHCILTFPSRWKSHKPSNQHYACRPHLIFIRPANYQSSFSSIFHSF
jgi:hypothetical protein